MLASPTQNSLDPMNLSEPSIASEPPEDVPWTPTTSGQPSQWRTRIADLAKKRAMWDRPLASRQTLGVSQRPLPALPDMDRDEILTQRLYASQRSKLEHQSRQFLQHHQSDPYFVTRVLHLLSKVDSNYQRQRVLLLLDQLEQEFQQEEVELQEQCDWAASRASNGANPWTGSRTPPDPVGAAPRLASPRLGADGRPDAPGSERASEDALDAALTLNSTLDSSRFRPTRGRSPRKRGPRRTAPDGSVGSDREAILRDQLTAERVRLLQEQTRLESMIHDLHHDLKDMEIARLFGDMASMAQLLDPETDDAPEGDGAATASVEPALTLLDAGESDDLMPLAGALDPVSASLVEVPADQESEMLH